MSLRSACFDALSARSTPIFSTASEASLRPAVSVSSTATPFISMFTLSASLVVPGISVTIARSLRVTEFASEWVVVATRSRTARIALADGESLGVRPEAAVAWTGARPTGFCPRLRLLDVLLPRGPRDLMLHFHGPAIVWIEGSENLPLRKAAPRKAAF